MTFNFNVGGITPSDSQGGGGSPSAPSVVQPSQVNGLCLWLDGDCNTRNGLDRTKLYMEDLVYNPPATDISYLTESITDNGSGNSWSNNMLVLGNYAKYPKVLKTGSSFTVETVFKKSKDIANILYILVGRDSSGGFGIYLRADNTIQYAIQNSNNNSSYTTLESDALENDKLYYATFTCESDSVVAMKINDSEKVSKNTGAFYQSTNDASNLVMGSNATGSSASTAWDGLQVGMLRIWNRVLTDSEIQRNYQDVKKRFNF